MTKATDIEAAAALPCPGAAQFAITETTFRGLLAKTVSGLSLLAVSGSGRKNAAEWGIVAADTPEDAPVQVLCWLKRKEVAGWLHRVARSEAIDLAFAREQVSEEERAPVAAEAAEMQIEMF